MIIKRKGFVLDSFNKTARITGILYIFIFILAGFGEGYVRSGLIVPGDGAATTQNIMSSQMLFRAGFVSDLLAFTIDLIVSVLLYILIKPVNKNVALITAALRLIAHPAIGIVNLLNHIAPIILISGTSSSIIPLEQIQTQVMFFLDMHRYGYLTAGAVFGLHLFFLGYIFYKAETFPTILGGLLIVAAAGYLTESFGNFLFPGHVETLSMIVIIPAVIAEMYLAIWLITRGIRKKAETQPGLQG